VLCDGAAYPRTTYARLFAAIGTRYGSPDAGRFNVPDLQERIPVGKGVHPDHNALGLSDNLALGQRRVKHAHETYGWHNTGAAAGTDVNVVPIGDAYIDGEELPHDHHPSDGQPYPVGGPAYLTINFIIIS
jgi:microcystin-dependent protein